MANGLSITFDLLTSTDNEAAVQVLIPALDCPNPVVQEGALIALLKRRTAAGGREILDRMSRMKPEWKTIIRQHRGRLTGALRDAILGTDAGALRKRLPGGGDVPRLRPGSHASYRTGKFDPAQFRTGGPDRAGTGGGPVRRTWRRPRPERSPRPADDPPLRARQPGVVGPSLQPAQAPRGDREFPPAGRSRQRHAAADPRQSPSCGVGGHDRRAVQEHAAGGPAAALEFSRRSARPRGHLERDRRP